MDIIDSAGLKDPPPVRKVTPTSCTLLVRGNDVDLLMGDYSGPSRNSG